MSPKTAVIRREYGTVGAPEAPFDASAWPDGQHYVDVLTREGVVVRSASGAAGVAPAADPLFWQACARWALMRKFRVLGDDNERLQAISYQKCEGKRKIDLSNDDILAINNRWSVLVSYVQSADMNASKRNDLPPDLVEFLQTGKSNGRALQWTVMECPAGLQFQLHGHPNIELVHCFRGELQEVRMKGDPLGTPFQENDPSMARGPNLTRMNRPWFFNTLHEGEWIVNEVGSVHKTFTASKGSGCGLLVLWGGSHSNVAPGDEPSTPNVQQAVDRMDSKLCTCDQWEVLPETFLPDSERSDA